MKYIASVFIVMMLFSCSSSSVEDVSFKSFGNNDIWICKMPEKDLSEIKSNGELLSNPESNIVVLFYFLESQEIPRIDNIHEFEAARDYINSFNPIATYWQYPNGSASVIDLDLTRN